MLLQHKCCALSNNSRVCLCVFIMITGWRCRGGWGCDPRRTHAQAGVRSVCVCACVLLCVCTLSVHSLLSWTMCYLSEMIRMVIVLHAELSACLSCKQHSMQVNEHIGVCNKLTHTCMYVRHYNTLHGSIAKQRLRRSFSVTDAHYSQTHTYIQRTHKHAQRRIDLARQQRKAEVEKILLYDGQREEGQGAFLVKFQGVCVLCVCCVCFMCACVFMFVCVNNPAVW